MFRHCKRLIHVVPRRGSMLHQQHVPLRRNIWGWYRPSDFRAMLRDVDRRMERFERDFIEPFSFRRLSPQSIPIQGVVQRGDVYRISVNMDGFKPEDITISLKENTLTIEGKINKKMDDGSKFQQECTREMTLPDDVDESSLKTFLGADGILSIEADYKPDRKSKEIPVSRQ
jgi:Molecular chaperone (small heat shock protein)